MSGGCPLKTSAVVASPVSLSDLSSYCARRPVYIGNFEYDASSREIERLCEKYGDLQRVDMKTG